MSSPGASRVDALVHVDVLHIIGLIDADQRDRAHAYIRSIPDTLPIMDGGSAYLYWREGAGFEPVGASRARRRSWWRR